MRCKYETGDLVAKTATPKSYEYLIEANGATFNAGQYPELALIYQGLTLPDMRARVLQGAADGETAGEYKEAGLPDHNHNILINVDTADGNGYQKYLPRNTQGRHVTIPSTQASESNPIYGASDTVQPPAMTVKYYVCYA